MKVLFVGFGRMGGALGKAWLERKLVDRIDAIDPQGRPSPQVNVYRSVDELPAGAYDLIVAAVKPDMAATALGRLSAGQLAGAVLVSVMAGVSTASLRKMLAASAPVVRAMPNTPVLVGAGCTGLYADAAVSSEQRERVQALFSAAGAAHWVKEESLLHAVTAISGSGPAYYHLFSEALAQAGCELGLEPELARALAAQTAAGAAGQQVLPDADVVALREAITSPNGTTAAAIQVFEHDATLRRLTLAAAQAAWVRSQELEQAAELD